MAQLAKDWFNSYQSAELKIPEVIITPIEVEAGHYRTEKRQFWQVPADLVFPQHLLNQWAGFADLGD